MGAILTRVITIALVCSIGAFGYALMSSSGGITGTPGMVSISPDVIIRQGNNVNYSFNEVTTLDRFAVGNDYIQVDTLRIQCTVSVGYLDHILCACDAAPSSTGHVFRAVATATADEATVPP